MLPDESKERLLRAYVAGEVDWTFLREQGFEDNIQVLGGLGGLGLRPPIAAIRGPNVEARLRGRAIIREARQNAKP